MKEKTLWFLGGIAVGAVGALAISGGKRQKKALPSSLRETPPIPANTANTTYLGGADVVNYPRGPALPTNTSAPPKSPANQAPTRTNAPPADLPANKDLFMRLAREWEGLGMLAGVLEGAGIAPALDTRAPTRDLLGTTFEETAQDSAALAAGVAIRFRPEIFELITDIANYPEGPRDSVGRKIFVDRDGRWFVWSGSEWGEFPLAPASLAIVDWDVLFAADTGQIHPGFRRGLTPQDEAAFVALEAEKAKGEEDYKPAPPPVRTLNTETGEWELAPPPTTTTLLSISQLYPNVLYRFAQNRLIPFLLLIFIIYWFFIK